MKLSRVYDKLGVTVVVVVIIVAAVLIALYDVPAPYPNCRPGEIGIQAKSKWWCVPGREP